jgi:hypothetical protein
MTTNVIEEVRRIAPPVPATSELGRARQRAKLTDAITVEASFPDREETLAPVTGVDSSRKGRVSRGRLHVVSAVVAIAAAAAAVAIPLSLGSTKPPTERVIESAAPVMALDGYRLRLPSDYRLTAANMSNCSPPGVAFVSPTSGPPRTSASPADVPGYASQTEVAANADGGCLSMVLAPPYTPTGTNPDPEAGTFEVEQPVQVGRYEGRAGAWYSVSKPSGARTEEQSLYVQIPIAGGQVQDLVVSANGLSESELISVVANGLMVAASS